MIYVHDKEWYLSLTEGKDTIEMMLENNDLDISGWDLRKTLRLLRKSNPPLLERIQSPILYEYNQEFLTGINRLARDHYSRLATIHHYLSMASKCYAEVTNTKEYKLKKFFYALRTAAACQWILEKEEIVPIEFEKLIAGLVIDPSAARRIDELIRLKSTQSESYLHTGEHEVLRFIRTCLLNAEAEAKKLPPSRAKRGDLDVFFRKNLTAG